MEYHQDRFDDYSLLVFKAEKLIAVIPANINDDNLYSHQGLTYGGFVFNESLKLNEVIQVFKNVLKFLESKNILNFEMKLMPSIYSTFPNEEIDYLLFILNGKLIRRDVLSVIDNTSEPISISNIRKRGVKKGKEQNLVIREEHNFENFWEKVLIPNLKSQHNTKPVHSLQEIKILHKCFPKNIRQFNIYRNNEIVGGTTVFETKNVAHIQYISATENKQELGSLDFLFKHLMNNIFKNKRFFDFGISNENKGKNINEGLLYWKESFGARTIIQDFYTLKTSNHNLLNNIMI